MEKTKASLSGNCEVFQSEVGVLSDPVAPLLPFFSWRSFLFLRFAGALADEALWESILPVCLYVPVCPSVWLCVGFFADVLYPVHVVTLTDNTGLKCV